MKFSTLFPLAATALALSSAFVAAAEEEEESMAQPLMFDKTETALVIVDPQNDFLSEEGVTWGVVGDSVTELDTVNNIEHLFKAARDYGFTVFISPHYYFPHDHGWKIEGNLEVVMHSIGMFDRPGALNLTGFEGSGADWLEQYKPYINADNVIVTNPHKIYGPEHNDLALQLRKRKFDNVVLSGMSANLCVESHMRELIEQGFQVTMVSDATAGPRIDGLGDGYESAMTNFKYIATAVINTTETVAAMAYSSELTKVDEELEEFVTRGAPNEESDSGSSDDRALRG